MKLTHLLPLLPVFASASTAPHADVYIFNPNEPQQPRPDRTLSPSIARLVLAQRAGVEDFHLSGALDQDSVEAINDYGHHTPLFSQHSEGHQRIQRSLILVRPLDEEEAAEYASWTQLPDFQISPLPSWSSTHQLFKDFNPQYQAQELPSKGPLVVLYNSSLWSAKEHFQRYMSVGNIAVTVVVYPQPVSNPDDGSGEWGTYEIPNSESKLLRKRQDPQEEPLEVETDFKPVQSSSSHLNTLADQSPLRGILPSCFPSLSACNEATRNCTGHGSCSLKYKDPDTNGPEPKPCYACQCSATKQTTSDGKEQTIYWGGPACQKRDVSMQFWLIALFSVAMVGLVSFAVGQVWSMGEEDLPSVIGAGVSGVHARTRG